MRTIRRATKRLIDIMLAVIAQLLLLPLFAVIALLVRRSSPGPVFFLQERAGLRGKPFRIFKFRTMLEQHDNHGVPLPDEKRITRIGRFLRATSIDELPQLLNIIRGEMSFIGPRPLPTKYLARYSAEQMRRHDVLPGMACYADVVLHRSVPDWETVFELDVWYVDHWSFWLDVRIFFCIAYMVLARKGVEQGASGQTPEFMPPSRDASRETQELPL